jgi:hypothetical protein
VANGVLWVEGDLETLGDPHNYINQDGLEFLRVVAPQSAPWTFTGLPVSRPQEMVIACSHIQMLMFPDEASMANFRLAPKTQVLMINLPLAVVRGAVPFLGESKLHNFLDFYKGAFVPLVDVGIHFLAEGSVGLPTQAKLLYVNRAAIQAYVLG